MVSNHKCSELQESLAHHKRYGDGDTDFDENDRGDGDDGDDGGFPGGSNFRRSRRIMQSRYTAGFSSAIKSKEHGSFGA